MTERVWVTHLSSCRRLRLPLPPSDRPSLRAARSRVASPGGGGGGGGTGEGTRKASKRGRRREGGSSAIGTVIWKRHSHCDIEHESFTLIACHHHHHHHHHHHAHLSHVSPKEYGREKGERRGALEAPVRESEHVKRQYMFPSSLPTWSDFG